MDLETIRTFVISKLHWIKKHQNRIRSQEREEPREFINRESHYYMGKRYLLKVVEHNSLPKVELQHDTIEMYVRPNTQMTPIIPAKIWNKIEEKSIPSNGFRCFSSTIPSMAPEKIAKIIILTSFIVGDMPNCI
jgi:predicted metal-dependent hydrolase